MCSSTVSALDTSQSDPAEWVACWQISSSVYFAHATSSFNYCDHLYGQILSPLAQRSHLCASMASQIPYWATWKLHYQWYMTWAVLISTHTRHCWNKFPGAPSFSFCALPDGMKWWGGSQSRQQYSKPSGFGSCWRTKFCFTSVRRDYKLNLRLLQTLFRITQS